MAKLKVQSREVIGKKVKNIRAEGSIPSSMYGPSFDSTNVTVDEKAFREVFMEAGYSALVDVELDGKKEKVVFKEVQIHPVTDEVLHVAMYVIDPKKPITADIPLEFNGVSPAEEDGEGFVSYALNDIAVRCLPKDLPSRLEVDVSVLKTVSDSILIGDIKLPENVELDSKMDEGSLVAFIATAQKVEDVLAEIEADHEAEAAAADDGEEVEGEADDAAEGEDSADDSEDKD